MKYLWEILVPTKYEDTGKPVSTRHHKSWDNYVMQFSSGMTILRPAKGTWLHQNERYDDRVIPVRIVCSKTDMKKIAKFSLKHYRQICIMYYRLSEEVEFLYDSERNT